MGTVSQDDGIRSGLLATEGDNVINETADQIRNQVSDMIRLYDYALFRKMVNPFTSVVLQRTTGQLTMWISGRRGMKKLTLTDIHTLTIHAVTVARANGIDDEHISRVVKESLVELGDMLL